MDLRKIITEEIINLNEERERFSVLYHGTDITSAQNIIKHGIKIDASTGGYFGKGFYTTPDLKLVKSNYADFAEDNQGVIMEFMLNPNANILDLRDEQDWDIWLKYARSVHNQDFYLTMIRNGIDGLWDNSFEGVVIYNPKALKFIKTISI